MINHELGTQISDVQLSHSVMAQPLGPLGFLNTCLRGLPDNQLF